MTTAPRLLSLFPPTGSDTTSSVTSHGIESKPNKANDKFTMTAILVETTGKEDGGGGIAVSVSSPRRRISMMDKADPATTAITTLQQSYGNNETTSGEDIGIEYTSASFDATMRSDDDDDNNNNMHESGGRVGYSPASSPSRSRKEPKRKRQKHHRLDLMELVNAKGKGIPLPSSISNAKTSFELFSAMKELHYFWTNPIFLQIYAVLVSAIVTRRFWVLQGIPVLSVLHMIRLAMAWGLFIWEEKDVKRVKGLVLWWTKFGLDFASKTVEGEAIHRVLASFTWNFWSMMGKNVTLGTIKVIAQANRKRVIDQTKENLRRANERRQRLMSSSLQR